jgi:hypothetical protein
MGAATGGDPGPSPFEVLDAQEQQEKIDTAVASMAPDVRNAWNGLAYDGISWSELGRREGLSDNGARKRYKPKFLDAFVGTADSDRADTVGCDRAKKQGGGIQLTYSDVSPGDRPSNYHWKCLIDVPNDAP